MEGKSRDFQSRFPCSVKQEGGHVFPTRWTLGKQEEPLGKEKVQRPPLDALLETL